MGKRIPFTLFLIVALLTSMHSTAAPQLNASDTIPLNFSDKTQNNWDYTKSYQPSMPNVTQYLDTQMTNFTPKGSQVYTGNDQVPGYLPRYFVNVTMTNLHIVKDHDTIGAGDIYIQGGINAFNDRYPATGNWQLNDGDNQALSNVTITGWVVNLGFHFEVIDDDAGISDSLGIISGDLLSFANQTFTESTDSGDASITFTVEVTQMDPNTSASELVNLYKPEMWVDDETSNTEMPDYVFARVISGTDNGIDALVLQYYFYWNAQYAPDAIGGFQTHQNDFQVFLVYLDTSDPLTPYRIVFNNWFYTDVTQAPSTQIDIFDANASPGTYTYNVDINPGLEGFLGSNVTLKANIHDIADITNWEYATLLHTNAFSYSPNGAVTVELTVETSYHSFDLGPIFSSGAYYGFNYAITDLTDAEIVDMYSIIQDTFDAGVHFWTYFGIDVPIVAPFSFDVTQVFTAPYAINAYANVIDNTAAITRAKNSRLDINITGYIGVGFEVPSTLQITHPDTMSAQTNTLTFELQPNTDQTVITLYYGLHVNISYVFWFMSGNVLYDHEGEIAFKPFTNETKAVAGLLGFGDYEKSDVQILSYLTGSLTLHPTLLGTILEGVLKLNILDVIDAIFGADPDVKIIVKVLEFIIDDFSLTMTASLVASVQHDISTTMPGVTFSKTSLEYTDNTPQTVDVTIPAGADLSQGFTLTVGNVGYVLDFSVAWSLDLAMKSPISTVVPDISIPIGTYPEWSAQLFTANSGSITIPGGANTSSGGSAPGPLIFISIGYIAIISKIKRKNSS